MPVHDIKVKQIRSGIDYGLAIIAKRSEVGRQDRGGDERFRQWTGDGA